MQYPPAYLQKKKAGTMSGPHFLFVHDIGIAVSFGGIGQ